MTNTYEGVFEIYRNGELFKIIKNKVTDNYLNYIAKLLLGISPPNLKINFLAVGSGEANPGDNPARLVNETFRTQYTTEPYYVGVGEIRTEFVILAEEAVGEIKEIGIFAGIGSTTTANSGILISRIPWTYTKTGSDEITIVRIDKIRRA